MAGKSISTVHDLDAPPDRVHDVMSSERWPQGLAAHLGDDSRLVRREQRPDGGVELEVSRALPQGVPGFLLPFLPGDGRLTQVDRWAPRSGDGWDADWEVGWPGAQGSLTGTTALRPQGDGTRWTVQGRIVIRVPLLGGKAEGFVAPLVARLLDRQAEVLADLLRG